MKRFDYLEKEGLNRQEKRRWVMKMEGFLREIAIKEGEMRVLKSLGFMRKGTKNAWNPKRLNVQSRAKWP